MQHNPIFGGSNAKPVTRDLDQFVAEANRRNFVIDSGRPYFVNTRRGDDGRPMLDDEGKPIRFMDRNG